MKRCPQCEFLYEDDQRLCDMDGASLVVDSRNLPNLNALGNKTPGLSLKNWRSRAVPVFAGLVLATVLGLVYYVQTQQSRSVSLPTASSSPVSRQLIAPAATPEAQPTTEEVKPAEEAVKAEPAAVKPKPSPKKAKKPAAKTGQRAVSEKRKDSKLNSLLKKTGQLFKKPFSKL
jgi:uncharacterized membrane protein YraQ (UPF0718 family)